MTQSIARSRAMLATLTIKKFSVSKTDKRATRTVIYDNKANRQAGRFSKVLFGNNEALKSIAKIDNFLRTEFYRLTMPWNETNQRLLPCKLHITLKNTFNEANERRGKMLDDFCANYDYHMDMARHQLGGLFNEDDYPTVEAFRAAFVLDLKFAPIPDGDDFRLSLAELEVEEIKQSVKKDFREQVTRATESVWERVIDQVSHMAQRLHDYEPATEDQKAKSVFRDSLVENVEELANLLPNLDIIGDPRVAKLSDRIHTDLCAVSPQELRESESTRKEVADKAKAIADNVSDWLS